MVGDACVNNSKCDNGKKKNPATKNAEDGQDCESCNPGYKLVGDACVAYKSKCDNGIKKTTATKDGEDCQSCNPGYKLVGDACVNNSKCDNGTKKNPATKNAEDGQDCASCNLGYKLDDDACTIVTCNRYALSTETGQTECCPNAPDNTETTPPGTCDFTCKNSYKKYTHRCLSAESNVVKKYNIRNPLLDINKLKISFSNASSQWNSKNTLKYYAVDSTIAYVDGGSKKVCFGQYYNTESDQSQCNTTYSDLGCFQKRVCQDHEVLVNGRCRNRTFMCPEDKPFAVPKNDGTNKYLCTNKESHKNGWTRNQMYEKGKDVVENYNFIDAGETITVARKPHYFKYENKSVYSTSDTELDLKVLENVSRDECEKECSNNLLCSAFTHTNDNKCYLKNQMWNQDQHMSSAQGYEQTDLYVKSQPNAVTYNWWMDGQCYLEYNAPINDDNWKNNRHIYKTTKLDKEDWKLGDASGVTETLLGTFTQRECFTKAFEYANTWRHFKVELDCDDKSNKRKSSCVGQSNNNTYNGDMIGDRVIVRTKYCDNAYQDCDINYKGKIVEVNPDFYQIKIDDYFNFEQSEQIKQGKLAMYPEVWQEWQVETAYRIPKKILLSLLSSDQLTPKANVGQNPGKYDDIYSNKLQNHYKEKGRPKTIKEAINVVDKLQKSTLLDNELKQQLDEIPEDCKTVLWGKLPPMNVHGLKSIVSPSTISRGGYTYHIPLNDKHRKSILKFMIESGMYSTHIMTNTDNKSCKDLFEQEGKNIPFDDDTAAYLKNFQVDVMYKDNPHKSPHVRKKQYNFHNWKNLYGNYNFVTSRQSRRDAYMLYGNKPIKDIVSLGIESIEDINLSKLWNFENLGEDKNIWFAKEEIRYAHEYNWLNAFESNPSKVNKWKNDFDVDVDVDVRYGQAPDVFSKYLYHMELAKKNTKTTPWEWGEGGFCFCLDGADVPTQMLEEEYDDEMFDWQPEAETVADTPGLCVMEGNSDWQSHLKDLRNRLIDVSTMDIWFTDKDSMVTNLTSSSLQAKRMYASFPFAENISKKPTIDFLQNDEFNVTALKALLKDAENDAYPTTTDINDNRIQCPVNTYGQPMYKGKNEGNDPFPTCKCLPGYEPNEHFQCEHFVDVANRKLKENAITTQDFYVELKNRIDTAFFNKNATTIQRLCQLVRTKKRLTSINVSDLDAYVTEKFNSLYQKSNLQTHCGDVNKFTCKDMCLENPMEAKAEVISTSGEDITVETKKGKVNKKYFPGVIDVHSFVNPHCTKEYPFLRSTLVEKGIKFVMGKQTKKGWAESFQFCWKKPWEAPATAPKVTYYNTDKCKFLKVKGDENGNPGDFSRGVNSIPLTIQRREFEVDPIAGINTEEACYDTRKKHNTCSISGFCCGDLRQWQTQIGQKDCLEFSKQCPSVCENNAAVKCSSDDDCGYMENENGEKDLSALNGTRVFHATAAKVTSGVIQDGKIVVDRLSKQSDVRNSYNNGNLLTDVSWEGVSTYFPTKEFTTPSKFCLANFASEGISRSSCNGWRDVKILEGSSLVSLRKGRRCLVQMCTKRENVWDSRRKKCFKRPDDLAYISNKTYESKWYICPHISGKYVEKLDVKTLGDYRIPIVHNNPEFNAEKCEVDSQGLSTYNECELSPKQYECPTNFPIDCNSVLPPTEDKWYSIANGYSIDDEKVPQRQQCNPEYDSFRPADSCHFNYFKNYCVKKEEIVTTKTD